MFANLNKENDLQAPLTGKSHLKTPGLGRMHSKTPFRGPLNDENGMMTINPKTGKKNLFAGKDPSQFVTPVGPRRNALAGKTTNLKARNLTPSVEQTEKKDLQSSVRPARTRVSFTAETRPAAVDDVPEIEYMPPRPKDLPFEADPEETFDFEELRNNYMRGCHRTYLSGLDEDGRTAVQREVDLLYLMSNRELDEETQEFLDQMNGISRKKIAAPTTMASRSLSVKKTRATGTIKSTSTVKSNATKESKRPASPISARPVSRGGTVDARRAASALSKRPTSRPTSAMSNRSEPPKPIGGHTRTASTSAKKPIGLQRSLSVSSRQPAQQQHSRSRSVSHAAHEAASKTTVGYTNGRKVADQVVPKSKKGKPVRETAQEAVERILAEDEALYGPIDAPTTSMSHLLLGIDEEDSENQIVVLDIPDPLMEMDEEFFFIPVPE